MPKAIDNYTTKIDPDRTVSEIVQLLARAGCSQLSIEWDPERRGRPTGFTFVAATRFGDRAFRLPVKPEGVWKALTKQCQDRVIERRFATREQAERVAWRLARDWVANSLSLIEVDLMTIDEAMFAQMLGPGAEKTIYEIQLERFLALPPGNREREVEG